MFFWKFTRSGRISSKYISLIMDFHDSNINNGYLVTSFEECKDMMLLIHDVETFNGLNNYSAGVTKLPFQTQVNQLGFKTTNRYTQQRINEGLVTGQMTLGVHSGTPLDYGESNRADNRCIYLDISKLDITMMINAKTGIIYGTEDKLKAYRNNPLFVNNGQYFDLMPKHNCMIEIVTKMFNYDPIQTRDFLINTLQWEEI